MTDLILNGLTADRDRMERLCRAVGQLGYACRLMLWSDTGVVAPQSECEEAGGGPNAPTAVEIICWTKLSIGAEGKLLQEHAVALKEEQRYLGLLLDEISPPAAVTGAQDISLHDWEAAADAAALAPLREALAEKLNRSSDNGAQRSAVMLLFAQIRALNWEGIKAQIVALTERIRRMHASIKALGVLGVLTFSLAAFGFFGGFKQNTENVCRYGWVEGMCRTLDIGNLPSQEELDEWARIEPGSSCEAFDHYLMQYGAEAEFADEAQLRRNQAQGAFGEQPMRVERPISFSPADRQPSRAAAIEALKARAQTEAESYCRITAQNFEGEARPGTFSMAGEPTCVSDGERFDCQANGIVECTFIVADMGRTCPPMSAKHDR